MLDKARITAQTAAEKTLLPPDQDKSVETQKVMRIINAGNLVYWMDNEKALQKIRGEVRRDQQDLDLQIQKAIVYPCWLILGKVYAAPIRGYFRSAIVITPKDMELMSSMIRRL